MVNRELMPYYHGISRLTFDDSQSVRIFCFGRLARMRLCMIEIE